ncbi:MAG: hypothetical protein Q9188_005453 [Gyalolechia gomerana]
MADNSATSHDLTIGHAAQVSLSQLCARILAYVETQPSITTLRSSVRHAPSSAALHSLPEEMISMVANYLRDMIFEDEIEKWLRLSRCLDGACETSSHLHRDEMAAPGYDSPNSDYDEALVEDAWQRHEEAVNYCYEDLTHLDGESDFAKRVQCFAKYSSIRPYFVMSKSYHALYASPAEFGINAKAYLVLPITKLPIRFTPGLDLATFTVNATIDRSLTTELSEDQRQEFRAVATMLKLHPYDAQEEMELTMELELHDLEVEKRRRKAYQAGLDVGTSNHAKGEEGRHSGGRDMGGEGDVGNSGEEGTNEECDAGAGNQGQGEEVLTIKWPRVALPRQYEPQKAFQPKLMILGCGEFSAITSE